MKVATKAKNKLAAKKNELVCRGCRRKVEESEVRVDVSISGGSEPKKRRWGIMHQACFLLAIGDPASIDIFA